MDLTRRFADARRALRTLGEALQMTAPTLLERDGIIQRFECSFEAARSPRACLRALGEVGLLDESETILALAMAEDRNRTVHTYIEEVAAQIHSKLGPYAALMQTMIGRMEEELT